MRPQEARVAWRGRGHATTAARLCVRLTKVWGVQTPFSSPADKILEDHVKRKPALSPLGEGQKAGPASPPKSLSVQLKGLNVGISDSHAGPVRAGGASARSPGGTQ